MEFFEPFTIYVYPPPMRLSLDTPPSPNTEIRRYALYIDLEKATDVLKSLQDAELKRLDQRETPSAYLIGPKDYLVLLNAKQKWPTLSSWLSLYSPVNNLEMFWKGVPIYCLDYLLQGAISTAAPRDVSKYFTALERRGYNDSPF